MSSSRTLSVAIVFVAAWATSCENHSTSIAADDCSTGASTNLQDAAAPKAQVVDATPPSDDSADASDASDTVTISVGPSYASKTCGVEIDGVCMTLDADVTKVIRSKLASGAKVFVVFPRGCHEFLHAAHVAELLKAEGAKKIVMSDPGICL